METSLMRWFNYVIRLKDFIMGDILLARSPFI